jgi:hypothetical protein
MTGVSVKAPVKNIIHLERYRSTTVPGNKDIRGPICHAELDEVIFACRHTLIIPMKASQTLDEHQKGCKPQFVSEFFGKMNHPTLRD